MLHKTNINCIFVERHSTRYDYANTEVRGEFVCGGAQAAYQDCEVRQYAGQNYPAGQYPSCRRQEWEKAHDRSGGGPCLQYFYHDGSECTRQLRRERPKGYARWTLRLLADKSVKLGYIDSISHTQVGRIHQVAA